MGAWRRAVATGSILAASLLLTEVVWSSGVVEGESPQTPVSDQIVDGSDMFIEDIGTLGQSPDSFAFTLNHAGQVVGYSGSSGFVWSEKDGMVDLGSLGGRTIAYNINNWGVVVGSSEDALGNDRAFRFTVDGGIEDVFHVAMASDWSRSTATPVVQSSVAEAVTDAGYIVGYYQGLNEEQWRGFIFGEDIGVTSVGTFKGGTESYAIDMNENGVVVGLADTREGQYHAFLYDMDGQEMSDLREFGGDWTRTWKTSEAWSINDRGSIVGIYSNWDDRTYGFLLEDGDLVDLGPYTDASDVSHETMANQISESGVIVGQTVADGDDPKCERCIGLVYDRVQDRWVDINSDSMLNGALASGGAFSNLLVACAEAGERIVGWGAPVGGGDGPRAYLTRLPNYEDFAR